jgi:hypothetical protein
MLNNLITIALSVPKELQEAIIREHYDDLVHRHPSVTRTIELIKQNYDFSYIKNKVTAFIKKYADC